MSRMLTGLVIVLLAGPPLQAENKLKDKGSTPAEQYEALEAEYQAAQKEFQDALRKAKIQREREKVFQEKAPKPDTFCPRFLELAEKNPRDAVAVDALLWVISHDRAWQVATTKPKRRALELLLRDQLDSPKLVAVCMYMGKLGNLDPMTESFLRAASESPHREVRGIACLALARLLKDEGARLENESEQLFDRITKVYADIKHPGPIGGQTLGDVAKRELFEIRDLAIGKPAPDIEGEDIDAKKFKLSDYRGKVVLLDFWGHW